MYHDTIYRKQSIPLPRKCGKYLRHFFRTNVDKQAAISAACARNLFAAVLFMPRRVGCGSWHPLQVMLRQLSTASWTFGMMLS